MFQSVNKSIWKDRDAILIFCIWFLVSTLFVMFYKRWLFDICYADVFALLSKFKDEIILPFTTLAIIFFIKNDFSMQLIVLQSRVRNVWMRETFKIALLSVYFSAVITVFAGILGKMFSCCRFNWNKEYSYFAYYTKGKTLETLHYPTLFLVFFLSTALTVFMAGMLVLLSYWLFHTYMIGFCFVAAYWSFRPDSDIFFQYCTADFNIWLNPVDWVSQLLYPLVAIGAAVVMGYILIRNREFGIEGRSGRRE